MHALQRLARMQACQRVPTHGVKQKRPKEQRQGGPETVALAGLATQAGPNEARFLDVDAVGLGSGRFLGEPKVGITREEKLKRGLVRGLIRGGVCVLIEAFAVDTTRHGRTAKRRAASLARRDPSTIPASAPLKPSSIPALV